MGSTGMILPTIPQATLMKWVGVVLVVGLIYSYGYFNGYESQAKATERALGELLEAEKALALAASQQASRDAQKVAQSVVEADNLRREYERAPAHQVDPSNCVSPEQRKLLQEAASRTAS